MKSITPLMDLAAEKTHVKTGLVNWIVEKYFSRKISRLKQREGGKERARKYRIKCKRDMWRNNKWLNIHAMKVPEGKE